MFNVVVLAVGKVKEKYYQEAIKEYLKRLKPFARVVVEEVEAEGFFENNLVKAQRDEAGKVLSRLEKYSEADIYFLDEKGVEFDSRGFAGLLEKNVGRQIVFVVGGTAGWDEDIKKKKNKLSLSSLTFPHELARLVLVEQVYRGITILKGKKYHY